MADFIKLYDEIPLCVGARVDDLQDLKLQISEHVCLFYISGTTSKRGQQQSIKFYYQSIGRQEICYSKESTCNFAYDNELLKIRLEEREKQTSFLKKEAKDLMKIFNVKMTSASSNFKSSKMESPTETNSSGQTLTPSNLPFRNPNGNNVDNTNDLKHLEQLNDYFIPQITNNLETPTIIKNSKKHSINSKTTDLFNKTSIEDISMMK